MCNRAIVSSVMVVCLLALAAAAQATVAIDMVTVGNPGNAMDAQYEPGWNFGAVDYTYKIGKYELTTTEFVPFLNAKGGLATSSVAQYYGGGMSGVTRTGTGVAGDLYVYTVNSGYENRPADNVSVWQAASYCNWLTNGQGNGSVTSGAYTGIGSYTNFARQLGAGTKYYLPTSDEWYKAAYYDPTLNGGAGGYWQYPNMSNTEMTSAEAKINDFMSHTVDVGSYPTQLSYYGTLDQGGNLSEGTDTLWTEQPVYYLSWGGNYQWDAYYTNGDYNNVITGVGQYGTQGFRLVQVTAVPEPSSLMLVAAGLVGLLAYAWRKRK